MKPAKTFSKLLEDAQVQIIGTVMVLQGVYDPRQHWLPFVSGVVVHNTAPKPPELDPISPSKRMLRTHYYIPETYRLHYIPQLNVPQLPLPFDEWKKLTNGMFKRIQAAKFPGWDRDGDGKALFINTETGRTKELREQCELMCKGRFFANGQRAYFELMSDYVMAKIAYGT